MKEWPLVEKMQKAKWGRPTRSPPEERLNGEPHFAERKEMGAHCLCCVKGKQTVERNNILLQDMK
jgi:hypothetical protein